MRVSGARPPHPQPRPALKTRARSGAGAARRFPTTPAPPIPSLSPSSADLLTALTTDVAYLGLSTAFVAVSGWPLLQRNGGSAPLDLTTADATRATPRAAFVLSTLLSFLPLINFTAWLLLMVTEGPRPRYWVYAALYALPFILTAAGGPGGDGLALEAAAVCALHFQVERLALAALDARAVAAEKAAGVAGEGDDPSGALGGGTSAGEELAAFDARLGARLAQGGRLRRLACAAGVPRAASARVGEVSAGLEAAVAGVDAAAPAVRAELIAEAQAALERRAAGRKGGQRRRKA